ncbi:hypothetical protein BEP19_04965 [Ammoniphilus oxalaticus]|uniref:DUF1657 domain-containing protein n=1 Tax=Ammoniphilus oxalaticus TaxID=66863 RepID=A0A419SIE6_9BACL|nr:DUF1657 domain-containing protein [Ammoniphilus oxalaticus]RKD23783.1 hypothetical protein BEP19_04965 [Ammoniphilus oxalaticus]
MTVGTQLHQTLASAEGLKASFKTFSLETDDQQAKQMFSQLAETMTNVVNSLQERVTYVEQQEPQYKMP